MKLPPKHRCIVEQKSLVKDLARCGVSAKKLDSITMGLTNTICKEPEIFIRDDPTGWSRIMIKEFPPDIPAIRIWFTFDDDNVYIESVELLSEFL